MKIKKLKLQNFLSYADQEFDFDRLDGPVLIVGKYEDGLAGESNGAGKSSVFEAISWSIFGTSRAKLDDELIRQGADDMAVTAIFEIDGAVYEVVRSRRRGKSQTLLFSDLTHDRKLRENSVASTEKAITRVLGMDYSVFSNTVFSPQGQLASFPSQPASRRKEVLSAILDIDAYSEIEDKAKQLASNYDRESAALQMNVSRIEIELGSEKIDPEEIAKTESEVQLLTTRADGLRTAIAEAEKQAEDLRSRAAWFVKLDGDLRSADADLERLAHQSKYLDQDRAQQIAAVDADVQRLTEQVSREPRLRSIIDEVQGKIRTYDEVAKRLAQMREERAGLQVERDSLRREIEASEADLQKLRKKLAQVQELGPRCPLCYSELTPECQAKISEDIIKEGTDKRAAHDLRAGRWKEIELRVQAIDGEIRTLGVEVDRQGELQRDLQRYQQELMQLEVAKTQLQNVDARRQQVDQMFSRRAKEIADERQRVQDKIAMMKSEIAKVTFNLKDVEDLGKRISAMQSEFGSVLRDRDIRSQSLGAMIAKRQAFETKSAQLEKDRNRLREVKDQEFVYRELGRAFGKNGIPALIMDNALAEIQSEVNKIMEHLTGGKIKVEFATEKELKSGKTAETMDIKVSDDLGVRDFNLYSGGEKARVALAIRLAMARVISRRAGKKIECVMIDEVSDLDSAGQASFAQMIHQISADYRQILVVTHLPELKSQFPNVLTIVKDRDGSHIEMEAAIA